LRPWGAQAQDKDAKPADKPAETPASPAPQEESSDHSIKIGAQTIPYKATAATILLKNEKDEPIALLYSTAYTRSDVKDPSTRPIAFVYNGGPGSASVWLHMGSFSRKRVASVNADATPPAPYKLTTPPRKKPATIGTGNIAAATTLASPVHQTSRAI